MTIQLTDVGNVRACVLFAGFIVFCFPTSKPRRTLLVIREYDVPSLRLRHPRLVSRHPKVRQLIVLVLPWSLGAPDVVNLSSSKLRPWILSACMCGVASNQCVAHTMGITSWFQDMLRIRRSIPKHPVVTSFHMQMNVFK